MLTISRIIELRDIIKWTPLFRAAGLNDSTLRSAIVEDAKRYAGKASPHDDLTLLVVKRVP